VRLGLKTLAANAAVSYNKNMTKYSAVLLCATLPFAGLPAQAQLPAAVKNLPRAAAQVNRRAASTALRQHALRAVMPLLRISNSVPPKEANPIPASIRRSVFTVQSTPDSPHKGSAFAVKIDGRVWGVTARHVRDDIGAAPYMTVPGPDGKPLLFPVEPVKEGAAAGADVSLFNIPQEAQELLLPLELADELPAAHAVLASSGFAHGNFLSQPTREVLFASRHRILTRYVPFHAQAGGYCGSPLLENGKVSAIHVGSLSGEKHQTAAWFHETLGRFNAPAQDISLAVPAFWVRLLARQAAGAYTQDQGVPLLFNGMEIMRLQTDESIQSLMQLRGGRVLKTLPRYPFMDFEHLETFFDVLPGDEFRLEVQAGNKNYPSRQTYWYEWREGENRVAKTLIK